MNYEVVADGKKYVFYGGFWVDNHFCRVSNALAENLNKKLSRMSEFKNCDIEDILEFSEIAKNNNNYTLAILGYENVVDRVYGKELLAVLNNVKNCFKSSNDAKRLYYLMHDFCEKHRCLMNNNEINIFLKNLDREIVKSKNALPLNKEIMELKSTLKEKKTVKKEKVVKYDMKNIEEIKKIIDFERIFLEQEKELVNIVSDINDDEIYIFAFGAINKVSSKGKYECRILHRGKLNIYSEILDDVDNLFQCQIRGISKVVEILEEECVLNIISNLDLKFSEVLSSKKDKDMEMVRLVEKLADKKLKLNQYYTPLKSKEVKELLDIHI